MEFGDRGDGGGTPRVDDTKSCGAKGRERPIRSFRTCIIHTWLVVAAYLSMNF